MKFRIVNYKLAYGFYLLGKMIPFRYKGFWEMKGKETWHEKPRKRDQYYLIEFRI